MLSPVYFSAQSCSRRAELVAEKCCTATLLATRMPFCYQFPPGFLWQNGGLVAKSVIPQPFWPQVDLLATSSAKNRRPGGTRLRPTFWRRPPLPSEWRRLRAARLRAGARAASALQDLEASVVPAQALARLSHLGPLHLGLDQQ